MALDAFRGTTDDLERSMIIEDLGQCLDERVVELFLQILSDERLDFNTRAGVLYELQFRNDSPLNRVRFGEAILVILQSERNLVLRENAAKAMVNCISISGAIELLEKIACNESEHLYVRQAALSALEANVSVPSCLAAVKRLVGVPVLDEKNKEILLRQSQSP